MSRRFLPISTSLDLIHSLALTTSIFPHLCHVRDHKNTVPETKTEEGSSKRNIMRKNDHDPHRKEKKQGGGGGGKGKWDDLDDGSMD